MILVHVSNTWPQVLAGQLTADDATLGEWFNISDTSLAEYGDAVLGIYENTVVSAFDVAGPPHRDTEGRVTFPGVPSTKWAHLIGTPNPGKPWGVRGMARPIQYLDSAVVAGGTVEVDETGTARRAVVDGFTLAVDHTGTAVLTVPTGRKVTMLATHNPDLSGTTAVNTSITGQPGAPRPLNTVDWLVHHRYAEALQAGAELEANPGRAAAVGLLAAHASWLDVRQVRQTVTFSADQQTASFDWEALRALADEKPDGLATEEDWSMLRVAVALALDMLGLRHLSSENIGLLSFAVEEIGRAAPAESSPTWWEVNGQSFI